MRRLRFVADERGVTLIELVVSMIIFSLVTAAALTVITQVQRQSIDIQARDESVGSARLALQNIDRQVRSGNVLYDPAAESLPLSMRVYTQANGEQRCVQWQVYQGKLRTRSWSPTWQTDGLVSSWSVVAAGVVNTTANPPFALQGGSTAYGSRLVDITLLVKDPKSSGKNIEVTSSLSGRNTQYGYNPGLCSPIPAA